MTIETIFKVIFINDLASLKEILSPYSLDHPLPHMIHRGQTPLTLAISLGRHVMIQELINAGASTLVKNEAGWNPFQEAISYGDRDTLKFIFKRRRQELSLWFHEKGQQVLSDLSNDLSHFYMEMKWSFKSILPYIAQLCPHVPSLYLFLHS
jgi:hypothetical protein